MEKFAFRCEVCGSDETEPRVEEFADDYVTFECWCPQCKRSWFEQYEMKLTGWSDKNHQWRTVFDWNAPTPEDVDADSEVRA